MGFESFESVKCETNIRCHTLRFPKSELNNENAEKNLFRSDCGSEPHAEVILEFICHY